MEQKKTVQPAPIHLLGREMSELIAAGEVVERPASIVKELLENAIDSGADTITLEIRNGGITFIRVTDNGCGIRAEDVPTAFLRHATSKIREKEDLQSILTFGFRGEALAAVAAVAKVELITRTAQELSGTRYCIEGSEEKSCEQIGCPLGTSITVRDLFYNTPARMKFLKRDAAETAAISGVVERIAISNPQVGMKFSVNGAVRLHTPGDGKQLSALHTVFGREFSSALLPVDHMGSGVSVKGYILKPTSARTNRSMQYFFVNDRYVRSKVCAAALDEGYKGSIMVGRFPACVLNVTLEPSLVDVNVHPAKIEVKFSDDKAVYDAIFFAVRSALQKNDLSPQVQLRGMDFKRQTSFDYRPKDFGTEKNETTAPSLRMTAEAFRTMHMQGPKTAQPSVETVPKAVQPSNSNGKERSVWPSLSQEKRSPSLRMAGHDSSIPILRDDGAEMLTTILPQASKEAKPVSNPPLESPEPQLDQHKEAAADCLLKKGRFENARIVGEVFGTYLLLEQENRLLLIDKHAAHERLLYEKLKSQADNGDRQMLLAPVILNLTSEECGALLQNGPALQAAGFVVESFGFNTVAVREVPLSVEKLDIAEVVTDLAQQLIKGRRQLLADLVDDLLHSIACRSAIKAHNQTSETEYREILRLLAEHEEVKFCPHGRPIAVVLTQYEIEKQFGRIGG